MREKLIELIKTGFSECWRPVEGYAEIVVEDLADYLIDHGVTLETDTIKTKFDRIYEYLTFHGVKPETVIKGGFKKPLTIAERADLERICISIEQKCREMAQPGMWERYTRHMECGEVREFAQYYRDMELVYKLITGHELWPPKEVV